MLGKSTRRASCRAEPDAQESQAAAEKAIPEGVDDVEDQLEDHGRSNSRTLGGPNRSRGDGRGARPSFTLKPRTLGVEEVDTGKQGWLV